MDEKDRSVYCCLIRSEALSVAEVYPNTAVFVRDQHATSSRGPYGTAPADVRELRIRSNISDRPDLFNAVKLSI